VGRTIARWMLVFGMLTATAAAQDVPAPAAAPLDIGEQVLEPGSSSYPAELAATGAQGTVHTRSTIGPDGRLLDAQVVTSSKSAQLDERAVAYVNKLRITSPVDSSPGRSALLQVTFARDTTSTILEKTCEEFNTDLAFARGLDPAATASDLRGYRLAQGLVMFAKNRDRKEIAVLAKNFKGAPAAIESACAAQPDGNFAATLERVITSK
jgi:TonB family protein